jgi:hypothetical protein
MSGWNLSPAQRTLALFLFLALALSGAALFFVPAFVIRPFRYQSPEALSLAMALRTVAPWATAVAATLVLLLAIVLWRRVSLGPKFVLVPGMLLVLFAAVMAQMNYFEWMFHPVKAAGFEPAASARLDDSEMVFAVRYGNDSRAYPIRAMGYHHIFNDVVGGVPIAVTY